MSVWAICRFFSVRARSFLPLTIVVAGCASPGPPKAPSLHLPAMVADLTAERVGEEVRLRWTTPAKTTDGLNLAGTVTAQICRRVMNGAVKAPSACTPIYRHAVKPGAAVAIDALPDALTHDSGALLGYQIELLNAGEHSAGLSSEAFAAGGACPPRVAGLRVEVTEAGALLRWKPEDAADAVELKRVHVEAAAKTGRSAGAAHPSVKEAAEVRLRAAEKGPAETPFLPDEGGTIDATARRGESFLYTAQRVRRVLLEGHALELRSAVSPPVSVMMRDTFPPRAPKGVEATAGELAGTWGIDLSWTPNTEDDLAGYLIYRREVDGPVTVLPLTPSPVPEPAFRDTRVVAEHTYFYTVVAVDLSGNRSAPSASAREEIRQP